MKQLEQRLREQILAQRNAFGNNESTKQTLIKLERDFERVQATAQSYKSKVSRQQKQFQQRGGAGNAMGGSSGWNENNNAANTLQQEQARFQMQVQEDVRKTVFFHNSLCTRFFLLKFSHTHTLVFFLLGYFVAKMISY